MEIIVCVKQVPDTTEVKIDPITNTLIRSGVPSIMNPFDKNAIEAALQLKEKHGGTITAITMGPPQSKEVLKECLSMGVDKVYLISDRAFGGADTLATSYTLASAIREVGKFDIIICGKQAIDGDTAQVGPETAENLGISQITYVSKIDIDGSKVIVQREHEEGYEVIETHIPTLLTVVKSINEPRYPTIKGKLKAARAEIPMLTLKDLNVEEKKVGLKGSPTNVKRIFSPPKRISGVRIQEEIGREAANELVRLLTESKII